MYQFGKKSNEKLLTSELTLQQLMREAISTSPIDFSIIEGYRNKENQNRFFQEGKTRVKYPKSMHNKTPSRAVDITPYPKGFTATHEEWDQLINHIKKIAIKNNINIRCGHDWDIFKDSPHIELV